MVLGLALSVCLLLVAGFVVHELAIHTASAKVEAIAARYGIQIQWRDIDFGWGKVTLTDFRCIAGQTAFRSPTVRVTISMDELVEQTLNFQSVEVMKPDGRLDFDSIRKFSRRNVSPDADVSAQSAPSASLMRAGDLPRILLTEPRLTLIRSGRAIAEFNGTHIKTESDGQAIVIEGAGELSVAGLKSSPFKLKGRIEPRERAFRAEFLPEPGGYLFSRGPATMRSLHLGRVGVEWADRTGVLSLSDISAERSRVRVEIPKLEFFLGTRGPRARASGAVLAITGGDSSSTSQPSAVGNGQGAGSVLQMLSGVELELVDMSIDYPGLPLMRGFQLVWLGPELELRGTLGGGEMRLSAHWPRGWSRPELLFVDMSKIDLAPLLGMAEEKKKSTLARRRILKGQIDASLAILPLEPGLETPLGMGATMVEGEVRWHGGVVHVDGVSPDPIVDLDMTINLSGEGSLDEGIVDMAGQVSIGEVTLDWKTQITDPLEDPVLKLSVDGRRQSCNGIVTAIPKGVLGPYSRVELDGRLKPHVRFAWPVHRPRKLRLRFNDFFEECTIKALNIGRAGWPNVRRAGERPQDVNDVDWLNRPFSLKLKEGVVGEEPIWVGPETPDYVPIAELPAYVGASAFLSEEINFNLNRPLDPGLVLRALKLNLDRGRFVYGGSTVTQQLVKNLFLTRDKSLARKVREVLIAARITEQVSRERVLELYLNCIEFGPDVYGIGAASRFYFDKDPRSLTPREAVFLAMLKPAPYRGAEMKRRGRTPAGSYWVERAEEIFDRLVRKGYLTAADAESELPYEIRWEDGVYISP